MDITSYLLGKQAGGGGGEVNLQNKDVTITTNGTTNISADTGYDGLRNVGVTTNVTPNLQNKSVTITSNTTTTIEKDNGYDGVGTVSVTTNVASSGLDWTALGYESTPQGVVDGYNYALEIKNNWVTAQDLSNKFNNDRRISIMPLVDTSTTTNMNYMFYTCSGLNSVPLLDTSNVTSMQFMFMGCTALYNVPLLNLEKVTSTSQMFNTCINLTSIPQFNTASVRDMRSMFSSCTNLKDIPVLDTSSCTKMTSIVGSCPNLTTQSLNNLLIMCINVSSSYSQTKTLANIGLTSADYPAATIQALPKYQDFIDAGWTIGYN